MVVIDAEAYLSVSHNGMRTPPPLINEAYKRRLLPSIFFNVIISLSGGTEIQSWNNYCQAHFSPP